MQVGKYELVRKLATGGMAEVFLAKAAGPMGFEKQVVLKRILPHLAEDAQFVEMFLSEARLAAQLNHPNIVQIYDFGVADGAYFLTMEYVDGPNLRVLLERSLAREEPLPLPVCARLVAEACEGLAYAHEFCSPGTGQPLHLVHRDVSLDNLLLAKNGTVKVVDFGVAKAQNQGHRTQNGLIKGKVAYMPPEQLEGRALDQRVDVYALGVVLHELVTGHRPYEAASDVAVIQAVLFQPLRPVRERRADVPDSLERAIAQALMRSPSERFQSCRALQEALEDYLQQSGAKVGSFQLSKWMASLEPPTGPANGAIGPGATDGGSGTERTYIRPSSGTHEAQVSKATARASPPAAHAAAPIPLLHPVPMGTPPHGAPPASPQSGTWPQQSTPPQQGTWSAPSQAPIPSWQGQPQQGAPPQAEWSAPSQTPAPSWQGQPQSYVGSPPQGIGQWAQAGATISVPPHPSHQPQSRVAPRPEHALSAEEELALLKARGGKSKWIAAFAVTAAVLMGAAVAMGKLGHREPVEKADKPTLLAQTGPSEAPAPKVPAPSLPTTPSHVAAPLKSEAPAGPKDTTPGLLVFRVFPYATVSLDGKVLGETPLSPRSVSPGSHDIRLVNEKLHKAVIVPFDVKPGVENIFKYNLKTAP